MPKARLFYDCDSEADSFEAYLNNLRSRIDF